MMYLSVAVLLFFAWMMRKVCMWKCGADLEIRRVRIEMARVEYENSIFCYEVR